MRSALRARVRKPVSKRRNRYLLIAAVLFMLTAVSVYAYFSPGFKLASWGEGTILVVGNSKKGAGHVRVEEREIYIAVEPLREFIDPHFFWDEAEKTAVITTAERVIHMHSEQLTAEVNLEPVELQFPLQEENDILYLPLLFLADFYNISVSHHPETGTVVIDHTGEPAYLAEVAAGVRLREGPGLRYPYLAQLQPGELLRLEENAGSGWCLVRTEKGMTGYLSWKKITLLGEYPTPLEEQKPEKTPAVELPPSPLVMVWEFTYPNPDVNQIGPMPSLQVVSPTWFHLADSSGAIQNLADPAYVQWARERGYKIWALVSNSYDHELTAAFLSSSDSRKKFIKQLLIFARLYDLDGLNLDFENFHYSYGDLYTQLVRELAPLCRAEGLVLSVDVSMVSSEPYWSRGFDRGALAEAADLIMLMAYDEHWASSPLPGSVASLPWVERGVKRVLEEVPAEKLVLAVPFYTRVWQVESQGGSEVSTGSRALSMGRVEELLTTRESVQEWDSSARQNKARYFEGEDEYLLWLEDAVSMRQRLQLIGQYGLAGVAGWRRGLEKPEIWNVFAAELGDESAKSP
jgi:spore germination protein YaaH